MRLAASRVELVVITGDYGHLAGDSVGAGAQRGEQRGECGLLLGEQLSLRLECLSFRLEPSPQSRTH